MNIKWNLNRDIVPLGTETMIVFRGGQGGNFLSTALNIALDVDTPDTSIGHNEYHNSSNQILPVRNTHINLWFKDYHAQPYGTETYTPSKYKEILGIFRNKNLRIILLNADPHTMLRTELIGTLKSQARGDLSPEFDLTADPSYRAIVDNTSVPLYLDIIRHYRNLETRLQHRNIDYLTLDYRDLFIDLNTVPLVEFLNITEKSATQLNNSIAEYTHRNRQLLNSVDIDFPA